MFQDKIKQLRLEHDMSQEDLAEILNVTRQSISKYENGSAEPSYDKLALLVDYFKVTYDDLLADTKPTQKETEKADKATTKTVKKGQTIEVISLLDDEAESQFVGFQVLEKPAYFDLDNRPDAVLQGIPDSTGSFFKPKNVDLAWYRTVEDAYQEQEAAREALLAGKKMYHLSHYVPVKKHGFFSIQIDEEAEEE